MNRSPHMGVRGALVGTGLLLAALAGCQIAAPAAVTVWIVGGPEALTHDTPPILENAVYSAARGELSLNAALNETIAFQIGLRAAAPPAGPLDVRVTDLTGPGDTLRAADAITVYRAHYTRVEHFRSWYPLSTGKPALPTLLPDILVPWEAPRGGGPLRLSETRNEIVWIDLHVPLTITPGEYRGRLELHGAGTDQPVFGCDIRLRVLPIALPGRRSLPVICRVDPREILATHLRWPHSAAENTRLLPGDPSHRAALRLVGNTMSLLHEHRVVPVLWASFPKFQMAGEGRVEVQWDEYDRLVAPWLDGSAFSDRVRLEYWPIPASLEYPNADRNGGLSSPRYARLLAAYLAECRRHFAERGWLDRAFLRICPPRPLSQAAVDAQRRVSNVVRQSETSVPLVAHLPVRSLAGLGWQNAPAVELTNIGIWAPPATWLEPEALAQQRNLSRRTWFQPTHPPYSGSLAIEAPPTDARALPWQAYRYDAEAIWIEHAAQTAGSAPPADSRHPWAGPGLLYPGAEYGLGDRPVPSIRLKRLRRGLQDYELLRLLEENGKPLLAHSLAQQVVRWAFTDACLDNLLSCKPTGWPRDPAIMRQARALILNELAGQFEPQRNARQHQIAFLTGWAQIMNQPDRVAARVDGVRLTRAPEGLRAQVRTSVVNATNRAVQGYWSLADPPPGWRQLGNVLTSVPPRARQTAQIELTLAGFPYNTSGVYPFELRFDTNMQPFGVPARLAVAACRRIEHAPRIDGRLDDWPLASSNAAGDFRLCSAPLESAPPTAQPTLPTQAFFTLDHDHLYVGVRCTLRSGEPPVWRADNTIPVDGFVPTGQDVVEILIDPRPTAAGTSGDLYCLQIKPSGLVIARHGCRTDPPTGRSQPWQCEARAAVQVGREAWVVELAIPLQAFGPQARRNPVWGCNVTRLDARRGEHSSWSGARGYCYNPPTLGNLLMPWP